MVTNHTCEDAVLTRVIETGSCSIDELVSQLTIYSWNEIFLTVDRMSRDGRLVLHRPSSGSIQITMPMSKPPVGKVIASGISIYLCMGCGYLSNKLGSRDGLPVWISGHVFRQRYGYGLSDANVIEDVCPSCAPVIALASEVAKTKSAALTEDGPSEPDLSQLYWKTRPGATKESTFFAR